MRSPRRSSSRRIESIQFGGKEMPDPGGNLPAFRQGYQELNSAGGAGSHPPGEHPSQGGGGQVAAPRPWPRLAPEAAAKACAQEPAGTFRHQAVILSPSTAGARPPVFLDIGCNRGGQFGDIGVAPGADAGTVYEVAQAALDLA